jgi:hypothetical protein
LILKGYQDAEKEKICGGESQRHGLYRDVDGEQIAVGANVVDMLEGSILIDAVQAPAGEYLTLLEARFRELYELDDDGTWPSLAAPLEVVKRDLSLAIALTRLSRFCIETDCVEMAWNSGFRLGRLYERLLVRRVEDDVRLGRQAREQRRRGGVARGRLTADHDALVVRLFNEESKAHVSRTVACERVAEKLTRLGLPVSGKTVARRLKKIQPKDNA